VFSVVRKRNIIMYLRQTVAETQDSGGSADSNVSARKLSGVLKKQRNRYPHVKDSSLWGFVTIFSSFGPSAPIWVLAYLHETLRWSARHKASLPVHKHRNTHTHTHTHNTKHPCPEWDSNPRSRPPSERRESTLPLGYGDRLVTILGSVK
jgi:hypothetical protein